MKLNIKKQSNLLNITLIVMIMCCSTLRGQQKVEIVPIQVSLRHGMALRITEKNETSLLKNPDHLLLRKQGATVAIWGEFDLEYAALLFYPRVPMAKGINYELVKNEDPDFKVLTTFTLGEFKAIKKTIVEAIYPMASVLPQNLLRVHVKFSRPMSPMSSNQFVRLTDLTDGSIEKNVFKRMKHEFWSEDGTQLSLYLDPGRIKTGLALNKRLGMPLKAGHIYKLEIDPAWEDIYGIPLLATMEKIFKVGPVDKEKLQEADLTVSFSLSEGVLVHFGHSINEPQLKGYSKINFNKKTVSGEWEAISSSLMKFIPDKELEDGTYTLLVSSDLEDTAGNSFRMNFESTHMTEYAKPYLIQKQFIINNKIQI